MMEVSLCPFSEGTLQTVSCSCLNEKVAGDGQIVQRGTVQFGPSLKKMFDEFGDCVQTGGQGRFYKRKKMEETCELTFEEMSSMLQQANRTMATDATPASGRKPKHAGKGRMINATG